MITKNNRRDYKMLELTAKKILLDLERKKEEKDFEKSKNNDNYAIENKGVQKNEMV